jgi:outer membrane protein assembly factor BamB
VDSGRSDGGFPSNGFVVATNRYDNARTGSNTKETLLTTANVKPGTFGLLFSRQIVGASYSQPLYVSGVTIGGAKHNVVYVATVENNLYAFDADNPGATAPFWQKNLGPTLTIGGAAFNPGCGDMQGSGNVIGITSTPVISVADNKIYVVSKGPGLHQLHAIDLATGAETAGSPVTIAMGMADFNPNIHLNRAGLLLVNGVVYIAFGSHCDYSAYHGFVFGYDAVTLQRKITYNTTPTGSQGAIWQSGVGLSSDGADVFASVANGSTGNGNMGQNALQLTPAGTAMTVTHNYQIASNGDNDLGSSGIAIMGGLGQITTGDKDGDLLLLGKTDFLLKQKIGLGGGISNVVFWEGSAGPMVFAWPEGGGLRSFRATNGMLTAAGTSTERKPSHPGGIFTISSNGAMPGTGILWASIADGGDAWHNVADGALYAFDAANVAAPSLWNSLLAPADDVGKFAKFSPPTVANGKVYLATFSGKLQVYGLK